MRGGGHPCFGPELAGEGGGVGVRQLSANAAQLGTSNLAARAGRGATCLRSLKCARAAHCVRALVGKAQMPRFRYTAHLFGSQ